MDRVNRKQASPERISFFFFFFKYLRNPGFSLVFYACTSDIKPRCFNVILTRTEVHISGTLYAVNFNHRG